MPTYAALEREAAYRAEFVTPAMAQMGRDVRAALSLPADAIGFKGNNVHLNGGHRSRRWILTSQYCDNRSYTVSYADDKLGDENAIAAFDISAPPSILLPMCQRLDVAVRAGELEELAAWYGNIDGDSRVDGYNNILNRLASSDSSHLTHLHGTVLRRHTNNLDFTRRLTAVLIGGADMTPDQSQSLDDTRFKVEALFFNRPEISGGAYAGADNELYKVLAGLKADVAALKTGGIDPAALAEAMKPHLEAAAKSGAEAAVRKVLGAVDGATPAAN